MARRRRRTHARSRRRRAALAVLGLIAAALLIWLDQGLIAPRWSDSPGSRREVFAADFSRYHARQFLVDRVVDGDTIHLAAPDGRALTTKVRLVGIDAPEMGNGESGPMYFAREATVFARQQTLGKPVTVYLDERAGSRDRYGRLLAYIELSDGRFLNEALLQQGYAYADPRFRHGYYQKYRQLEAGARARKEGLWAQVTPDQMPQWLQRRQSAAD